MVAGFWKHILRRLHIQRKLSSARHPQTNGGTEWVNQTLEQYLRCFTAYQQEDWEDWFSLAEFHYNDTVHSATKMTPFFANYGFHPRTIAVPSTSKAHSLPSAEERADYLKRLRMLMTEQLRRATSRAKDNADRSRSDAFHFAVGDQVLLRTDGLTCAQPAAKLADKFTGPFPVTHVVNNVTYTLRLPSQWRIHNTFHVSQLKPYHQNRLPGRPVASPPPPIVIEEESSEPLYIVNDILDSRRHRRQLQYLVDWEGYPPSERSWEPARSLAENSPALRHVITEFHARYPDKPGPLNNQF